MPEFEGACNHFKVSSERVYDCTRTECSFLISKDVDCRDSGINEPFSCSQDTDCLYGGGLHPTKKTPRENNQNVPLGQAEHSYALETEPFTLANVPGRHTPCEMHVLVLAFGDGRHW